MNRKAKTEVKEDNLAAWLGDAPGAAQNDPVFDALDALLGPGPAPQAVRAAQALLRAGRGGRKGGSMWYDFVETSLGQVFFAATGDGLVAVDFGLTERDFLSRLRARFGTQAVRTPQRVARFGKQLADYVAGRRAAFDLPLDLARVPDFQRQVLLEALQIPRGQVTTYGEIARRIGRPRASRAVGQALGHNPIPLVIPCHRVVGSDGSLRGYGSGRGIETKAQLLRLEGAR